MLTLAIGILGNTTIFSGVNALLFTPLPAERPEQIAQILPANVSALKISAVDCRSSRSSCTWRCATTTPHLSRWLQSGT